MNDRSPHGAESADDNISEFETGAAPTAISRRQFMAAGALGSAALPLVAGEVGSPAAGGAEHRLEQVESARLVAGNSANSARSQAGEVAAAAYLDTTPDSAHWLDNAAPAAFAGATWGMPWPRGKHRESTRFALRAKNGKLLPLQSWPTAYWPDGSLKWTAHAVPADLTAAEASTHFQVVPARKPPTPAKALTLEESSDAIDVDTGVVQCRIPKQGGFVLSSVARAGQPLLTNGRLVLLRQDQADPIDTVVNTEAFESIIERVSVEQTGPIRAVVKIEGKHTHTATGRRWLPFTLRLYFYAGGEALRVLHTIIFDGDESRDFIKGIGLRFTTPLKDALHDRHVRFAGEEKGVFGEAVRGLTGLRRDPGAAVRNAQIAGLATPPVETFARTVSSRLDLIPAFGDWTLFQHSADSFAIRKRTKAGHSWLDADRGRRSAGLGYVGGPSGGVAFGIRNFWQSHPAQLDIRNAATDAGEVTLWVWAPGAAPMDLRFYHDGMGQDTFEKQREGLEITYEDYEPGFGTPLGVARTSELLLWALPATPSRERFTELAAALSSPPVLVATPHTLASSGVFAHGFSLPDRTTARRQEIEDRLDWLFDFYHREQDKRGWYGFWNYGDVMHSYDADRHVWKYDVGGFAWDNSELSTDIWLWLYFLRTGRADVFRFAEAMTRHTGEVDVHHIGRFAPLGSRHNVMHWGCSAKQLRISTALNRRYYYYLTGDERVGDLMREQLNAARTLREIEPGRKLPGQPAKAPVDPRGTYADLGFGTDWGSVAGALLTEWERTRDSKTRDKLFAGMRTIGAQPKGFFTGGGRMNLDTGEFDIATSPKVSVSHLSAVFGLPEVCAELVELLPEPAFERAWIQYCELYNASPEDQERELGEKLTGLNLAQGHSRLSAYAAHRKKDAQLAQRAWKEFDAGGAGFPTKLAYTSLRIDGPAVLNPVDEAAWLSTNAAAQWGLAAIECLAFAGNGLSKE